MAQAVAAMAGLCSATPAILEGSLVSSSASQLKSSHCGSGRVAMRRVDVVAVCSQGSEDVELQTRRSMLGLLAATVAAGALARDARAEGILLDLKPPPPPFGGLPGTENADEARDLDKPLKNRFFLQPLPTTEAVARAKESAEAIVGVKPLIEKKAWPYVQNELRSKAGYLRFDLSTVISAKPKEEKKVLKALLASLYASIDKLDYAARSKSLPNAEKYYAETVSKLEDVLSKL